MVELEIEILPLNSQNQQEISFLNYCVESSDFKCFISNDTFNPNSRSYIIRQGNENVGILFPNISDATGKKVSTPIIYMTKRKTKTTGLVLGEIIYLLFQKSHVDIIRMLVFSNNIGMINLLLNFGIHLDGIYKKGKKIDNELVDIYFFSITSQDINKMTKKYMNMIGFNKRR